MTRRMKKIITFFLLCLAVNSYSQKYKLTYSGSIYTDFCPPDPFSGARNSISLNNNAILNATCGNPEYATNLVKEINYKPNRITSIVTYKERNSTTTTFFRDIINITLNHCDSWNGNEDSYPNTSFAGNGNFSFTIEPIINIVLPSIDPSCSVFISADNAGFETDIYNWEFKTLADEWKPLPSSFQGKPNFEIALTDLFGANAYQYFNKTINFRIRYCQTRFTNPVSFTFIPCSPNVTAPIEKENTSCTYNNDGIVTLTFDRPLIEKDERFEFSFFKNNALIITPLYSVDVATNKKYTFSGLAAGNYYVIYQTFIGSQQTSVNKEPYPSFTINPATPLTFELQNPKNPSCFGAEDGSVEVLITSGIPKNFELNGKPAATVKISDTRYRIDGLGANALGHKIKVTDANNCIDTN